MYHILTYDSLPNLKIKYININLNERDSIIEKDDCRKEQIGGENL